MKAILVTGMVSSLALSGCSLFKKGDSEGGDPMDAGEEPTASTDAVPDAGSADAPPDFADASGEAPAPIPDAPPEESTPPIPDAPVADASTPVSEVPAEPPAPSTEYASSESAPAESYTLQSGDTLMKIAFETYADLYRWKEIYEANRDVIKDPSHLEVGVAIKLVQPASSISIERNGEKYLIKNGDTLGSISEDVYKTKTKWRVLYENNRQLIKDPNKIFAGFFLYYVPEAGNSTPNTSAPLAEAPTEPAAAAPAPNEVPAAESAAAAPAAPDERAPASQ